MKEFGIKYNGEEKMDEKEFVDKTMENLILEGALQFAGVDPDTGEMLYNFTSKLKEVMPELYDEHISFVNTEIMHLWERGFLDVSILDEDPKVTLTLKAFDKNETMKLSEQHQFALKEIKQALKVI